jgi:hypothetical protein
MSDDEGLLQPLRDFTVRICHAKTDAVVGTGVVISADGKIVTCAHVVRAAGVNPRTGRCFPTFWQLVLGSLFGRRSKGSAGAGDAEIGVYFPQLRDDKTKARRATVAACFPQHDDDVVLLQLTGGPAPLGPEQIAILGTAGGADGHHFRTFGYRRLEKYQGLPGEGRIVGSADKPADGRRGDRDDPRAAAPRRRTRASGTSPDDG